MYRRLLAGSEHEVPYNDLVILKYFFTANASQPWIKLSATEGKVEGDTTVWVNIDWSLAPKGYPCKYTGLATFSPDLH